MNAILGSYPFTVTATDSSQFPDTGSQQYTITADPYVVATSQPSRYLPGRPPEMPIRELT